MATHIFLLPDIKLNSGLGNSDRLWEATSFSAWLLRKQESVSVLRCVYVTVRKRSVWVWVIPGPQYLSSKLHLLLCLSARIHFPLTIATSVSCASLMKWFRTLRSQIGLSGDGRPGRVHSNTINSKASSPGVTDTKTVTQRLLNIQNEWRQTQYAFCSMPWGTGVKFSHFNFLLIESVILQQDYEALIVFFFSFLPRSCSLLFLSCSYSEIFTASLTLKRASCTERYRIK